MIKGADWGHVPLRVNLETLDMTYYFEKFEFCLHHPRAYAKISAIKI